MKKAVILYVSLMLLAIGLLSFSTYTPAPDVDAEVQALVDRHAKEKHLTTMDLKDGAVTAQAR